MLILVIVYRFIFGCTEVSTVHTGFSPAPPSGSYSLVVVLGLLIATAPLVAKHRLLGAQASAVAAHRLRCSMAWGLFPDQGSNPCPLCWQEDSTTRPSGKAPLYLKKFFLVTLRSLWDLSSQIRD